MDLPPADSSSNCHRWQRTWGWGRAGPGQGRGKPGGHRGPGPQELNGSRAPAPDLGAAEAAWTCSVFALPRPEQLAPACRCLQGEAPRDAAARLPPPCPARARLAAHQVGALSAWGDFSPGPETPPESAGRGSCTPSQSASPSWRRPCPRPSIPLGSSAAVTQKQLFGLWDAQALHSSEQAPGWGPRGSLGRVLLPREGGGPQAPLQQEKLRHPATPSPLRSTSFLLGALPGSGIRFRGPPSSPQSSSDTPVCLPPPFTRSLQGLGSCWDQGLAPTRAGP